MRGRKSTPLGSKPAPAAHMGPLSIPFRQCMEADARIRHRHGVGDVIVAVVQISDVCAENSLRFQLLAPSAFLRPGLLVNEI
jgi:hypothetical protein